LTPSSGLFSVPFSARFPPFERRNPFGGCGPPFVDGPQPFCTEFFFLLLFRPSRGCGISCRFFFCDVVRQSSEVAFFFFCGEGDLFLSLLRSPPPGRGHQSGTIFASWEGCLIFFPIFFVVASPGPMVAIRLARWVFHSVPTLIFGFFTLLGPMSLDHPPVAQFFKYNAPPHQFP